MTIYCLLHTQETLVMTNARLFRTSEEAHQAMHDHMNHVRETFSSVYTSDGIGSYVDDSGHFHVIKVQKLEL